MERGNSILHTDATSAASTKIDKPFLFECMVKSSHRIDPPLGSELIRTGEDSRIHEDEIGG